MLQKQHLQPSLSNTSLVFSRASEDYKSTNHPHLSSSDSDLFPTFQLCAVPNLLRLITLYLDYLDYRPFAQVFPKTDTKQDT